MTAQGAAVASLGPGEYVGEIALLHDVPRTATVTASTDVDVFALERDDFLSIMTSHAPSREAAEAVARARLTDLRGRGRPAAFAGTLSRACYATWVPVEPHQLRGELVGERVDREAKCRAS